VPQSVTTSTEIEILAGVARHILTPRAEHKPSLSAATLGTSSCRSRRAHRAQGVLQPVSHFTTHDGVPFPLPDGATHYTGACISELPAASHPHIDNGKTSCAAAWRRAASTELYQQQSMRGYSVKKTRAPPRVVSYRTTHCRTWVRTG
jgi:hypothetical protein